jgi:hypothetical protein
VLVGVSQVNKAGRPEGRERILHEADVAIACSDMRWTVVKSRYQSTDVGGDVLPGAETEEEEEEEEPANENA